MPWSIFICAVASQLVEASAFLALTPALVRYRTHGIRRDAEGRDRRSESDHGQNFPGGGRCTFFAPPPERFLQKLVDRDELTAEQAQWPPRFPWPRM